MRGVIRGQSIHPLFLRVIAMFCTRFFICMNCGAGPAPLSEYTNRRIYYEAE